MLGFRPGRPRLDDSERRKFPGKAAVGSVGSMKFGARLYTISRRRRTVGTALLVAVVACLVTLYQPSLSPPGLHSRQLRIGAASTELLVAEPNLIVGGSSSDYDALVNRAILVGDVMASPPVLNEIGRAIGVPGKSIQASAPVTANVPRALIDPGSGGSATDIIASPDHYKLEIQADPSVPILHIYTQAPSAEGAIRFATASVQSVISYIKQMEASGSVPPSQQVHVEQLGTAQGGIANPGGTEQISFLVFVGTFAITLWFLVLASKVRSGWVSARLAEQPQP
jgi:hypothetical protein